MEFLSDEWIDALDAAARGRVVPEDDPLADLSLVLEQAVNGTAWRMIIDHGAITVRRTSADDRAADVRLACDDEVARAIAAGARPALDAFIAGDLRIGGDVRALIEHRAALETLGDLFTAVG